QREFVTRFLLDGEGGAIGPAALRRQHRLEDDRAGDSVLSRGCRGRRVELGQLARIERQHDELRRAMQRQLADPWTLGLAAEMIEDGCRWRVETHAFLGVAVAPRDVDVL